MTTRSYRALPLRSAALLTLLLTGSIALAEVPPPPNDTPATAIDVGTAPAVITGTNVNATDSISATPLGNLPSVPGPDVFYTFTPTTSGSYSFVMIPWIDTPVYGASGGLLPVPNLCLYVRNQSGTVIAGSNANFRDIADSVTVTLTANQTYEIVIDSAESDPRGQEFEFTLVVAQPTPESAEDCATAGELSGDNLPVAVVSSLTGATHDFNLVEGPGKCDVVDASGLALPAPDHVYAFTTGPDPSFAGDYVVTLVPHGIAWNGLVYVADSCPPFFPLGCLGAASHTNSQTRQAESVVVSLDWDTTYYIYVDAATFILPNAEYTLLIDRAQNFSSTELEPNDADNQPNALAAQQNGGQILGGGDADTWAVFANAGDRIYAFVDNGNTLLSSINVDLTLLQPFGFSVVEFDDDDGEGSLSPIATQVLRSSAFSAAIAGARTTAAGEHLLSISAGDAVNVVARYLLHVGVQPADRDPAPECEPNAQPGFADRSAKEYFTGAISEQGDADSFTFDAAVGDRVFIALDGDPERNSGGFDADSPNALNAALTVLDPDGDVFLEHDDANIILAGQEPDYPAEAIFFVAPLTGTYTVQVTGSDVETDFGPGRTYELAIFKNDLAPALSEPLDPVIDSIVPNFMTDTIDITASDDEAGDSGICGVDLAPGSTNLQITNLSFAPGDPTVSFSLALINPVDSGEGKIIVTDCAGNTACSFVEIDAGAPICSGMVTTPGNRFFEYTGPPIHVPDNQPSGPGIESAISVPAGIVNDVNVTVTIEGTRVPDIDIFLRSPSGTLVDVVSDRGSVIAYDITNATFDDSATEQMPIFSSDEPYTGTWLPDDENGGLARYNGQQAQGNWTLNVRDDSNSSNGGARLVHWALEIDAGFPAPEQFEGTVADNTGISTIELVSGTNAVLEVDPSFSPGDLQATYIVRLLNPSAPGSATVRVTDVSDNTCETPITLAGVPDSTLPANTATLTRNFTFSAEVQQRVPPVNPAGALSTVVVNESIKIAQLIVELVVNTEDVGRLAATLESDGETAVLINRVGMDERGSVGLTKDNLSLLLDDDAPVEDDAHLEPALGSIEFIGRHQPDGRGEFIGDGIDTDIRDSMLFVFDGFDTAGTWDLRVADFRLQGASGVRHEFRRWSATAIAPGAAQRLVGTVREPFPQAGVCELLLTPESDNLVVEAEFNAGDAVVEYVVSLLDPTLPGSGTLIIRDCANNDRLVAVNLLPQAADQSLPVIADDPNCVHCFNATDDGPQDTGIESVELLPWSENLIITGLVPDPPNGTASVSFAVALADPGLNGRGVIRVTDGQGFRAHRVVEIDAQAPVCTGTINRTRRYVANDLPQELPDNSAAGVTSTIVVPDSDLVTDFNINFNITHNADFDIDMTFVAPIVQELFSDVGSVGNDFIDVVLDSDADFTIDQGSAPFTGEFQPEPPGSLTLYEGSPAAGTYTLRVADDAQFNRGTFESWAIEISADTFPLRYAGRVTDNVALDTGIESIELLPGSENVTLSVDPFDAGAGIVRYSVDLINEALAGSATVRVTDAAGNHCDVVVCIPFSMPPAMFGDLNGDGAINFADFLLVESCFSPPLPQGLAPCDNCALADYDTDDDNDIADFAQFQANFGG